MGRLGLLLFFLFSLSGCAVKTGAEVVALDEQINLCRVIRAPTATWRMCRTHPSVTPEVLDEARRIHERLGVPLTTAIRALTGWQVYGLQVDTPSQLDEWRAAMRAQ